MDKSNWASNSMSHFQWQRQAEIHSFPRSDTETTVAPSSVLNGTHYIADMDCEGTLRCVQQVLTNRQEFCVHPPQYSPEPDLQAVADATLTKPSAFFQSLSAGTNGEPKRIRRTHQSWISSFAINAQSASITSLDSYAIIGRPSHSLALYAALEAAHLGADVHALTELRPDRQLHAIAAMRSSILYATPTQLRLICKHANDADRENLSVRHIFCGGGKLDQATANAVNELFYPAKIQAFYGASETSFISITDDNTPAGSVGKPYPHVEILISENANEISADDKSNTGEIWVRSPYVFHSYADKEAEVARWRDGYISVGEIGHVDKNGYLFLAGRQSRRVNIADTVVYPEQIETVLHEHAAVNQCVVIPIENEKRGCVLIAVVEGPSCAKLKQILLVYLRQCVGTLKAPRDIIFVSKIPLLASGKPDLIALTSRIQHAQDLQEQKQVQQKERQQHREKY